MTGSLIVRVPSDATCVSIDMLFRDKPKVDVSVDKKSCSRYDLVEVELCLATTVSRTSRLQRLLTSHISATCLHNTARTLHDLNNERASLINVR